MRPRVMAPETVCALRRQIAEIEGRPQASIDLDSASGDLDPASGDRGRDKAGGAALNRRPDVPPPPQMRSKRAGAILPFGLAAIDRMFRNGGLGCRGLHEIHAGEARAGGAAAGFLAALVARLTGQRGGHVLWASDPTSPHEAAALYGPGLSRLGLDPGRVLGAACRNAQDVLWAMEEGLACSGLLAVIGEVRGDPRPLDLLASRRLGLRAQRSGILTVLLRHAGAEPAMTANTRWRVAPGPASEEGGIVWRVDLEKNRDGPIGTWMVEWNHDDRSFTLASTHPVDLAATAGDRPMGPPAMGQIVALGRAS